MKRWAWVWLGTLALLGWAPALVVAYALALAFALGTRLPGQLVFLATYALILGIALLMLGQVRQHFALAGKEATWYTWAGGTTLVVVWTTACICLTMP